MSRQRKPDYDPVYDRQPPELLGDWSSLDTEETKKLLFALMSHLGLRAFRHVTEIRDLNYPSRDETKVEFTVEKEPLD